MAAISPRLAIGLSHNPDVFDFTAVLPLVLTDPPSLKGPSLFNIRVQDHSDALWVVRETLSGNSPRRFQRTGYGTRLRWQIEPFFETTANPFNVQQQLPQPDLPGLGPQGPLTTYADDSSLFSLSSAFGRSSGGPAGVNPAGSINPPHIFVCTGYLTNAQQWWPAELSTADTVGTTEQNYPWKTWARSMQFELTTKQTFNFVKPQYIPGRNIHTSGVQGGSGIQISTFTQTSPGLTNAVMVLNAPIKSDVIVGDFVLVYFPNTATAVPGGPLAIILFTITSISGDRMTIGLAAAGAAYSGTNYWPTVNLTPSGGNPPNPGAFWTSQTDTSIWFPVYASSPYVGSALPPQFIPNKSYTQLVGVV